MGNMSYCRWRNTLGDFRDCASAAEDILLGEEKLGEDERDAMVWLVKRAAEFLDNLREELGSTPTRARSG